MVEMWQKERTHEMLNFSQIQCLLITLPEKKEFKSKCERHGLMKILGTPFLYVFRSI
jgi:hypothetical protein